jgi:5-methylcytosine-specific restriction endonuclease McrA
MVLNEAVIEHFDPNRKRVTKWCRCAQCQKPEPKYLCAVDHVSPVIPINSSMEELSIDEVVNRIWCEKNNLQVLCEECHTVKTKAENKERRQLKKLKKEKEKANGR